MIDWTNLKLQYDSDLIKLTYVACWLQSEAQHYVVLHTSSSEQRSLEREQCRETVGVILEGWCFRAGCRQERCAESELDKHYGGWTVRERKRTHELEPVKRNIRKLPPPQSGPPLPEPSSCQNSAHFLCSYWDSHLGHSIHEMCLALSLSLSKIICVLFKKCRLHMVFRS